MLPQRLRSTSHHHVSLPPYATNSLAPSPFSPDLIAVASGTNFGLQGQGALHIIRKNVDNSLNQVSRYRTPDCVFDLAWSEKHQDILAAACGDGSVLLYNINQPNEQPISIWKEHTREVFGIDWSNLQKDTFATCSWDGTIKLWTTNSPRSIKTIPPSNFPSSTSPPPCVYTTLFSPHDLNLIASSTSSGLIHIHDLRNQPNSSMILSILAHPSSECLTFDWNKYDKNILVSGGTDKALRLWDLRMISVAGGGGDPGGTQKGRVGEGRGHGLAVKRVQSVFSLCCPPLRFSTILTSSLWTTRFSPYAKDILASVSYDMTCKT